MNKKENKKVLCPECGRLTGLKIKISSYKYKCEYCGKPFIYASKQPLKVKK